MDLREKIVVKAEIQLSRLTKVASCATFATMMQNTLRDILHSRGIKAANLARELGVDKAQVTRWSKGRIPAERVIDIERATGVPRHHLRPDLYPLEGRASVVGPEAAE